MPLRLCGYVILALAVVHPALAGGLAQALGTAVDATVSGDAATLEPIACWWRTGAGAVRVGERFTLVLTCSVVETASTTVVPDQSKLDPAVLQLPPFEVVSGTQATQVRTGTQRIFQYEYALRYVGETFAGDVGLPPLTITYRVQSRVAQDAASQGRDRQYMLPVVTIRILSLVPATANDIRDQPVETFRQIDERRFRASVLRVVAGLLYLVGGVVVVSGLTRALRRAPGRTRATDGFVSEGAILHESFDELDEVRRLRGIDGWTDALAARALAPLRLVVGSVLARRAVQVRDGNLQPCEGQLLVRRRWPQRGAALVSSAATTRTLVEARSAANGAGGMPDADVAADLDNAMSRFAAAAYGRDRAGISNADLDDALDIGLRALARAQSEHTWHARARRSVASSLVRLKVRTSGVDVASSPDRLRDRA